MSRAVPALIGVMLALCPGDLRAEGLIVRLPADGSRASYELRSKVELDAGDLDLAGLALPETIDARGTITLGSVGRTGIDGRECRWIEIGREIPDQKVRSALRLLIPEAHFGRGEDPLAHVLRMEHRNPGGRVEGPEPIVDPARKRYEIERFRNLIPDRLRDARPLGKRAIPTPLGPIECEGRSGTAELAPSPLFPGTGGEWAWTATVEVWEDDESPFGVVSLQTRSTGHETMGTPGRKVRFRSETTLLLRAVGEDAPIPRDGPPPVVERTASVKGRVTDPAGKPVPGVRVLFGKPGSNEILATVTAADGTYEGKAPVGAGTVRVTHRTVGPGGKPKAVILLEKPVEIPAGGTTLDLTTQKETPK